MGVNINNYVFNTHAWKTDNKKRLWSYNFFFANNNSKQLFYSPVFKKM